MTALSETIIGTLVGGLIVLAGTVLTGYLQHRQALAQTRRDRSAAWAAQQRAWVLDVQEAVHVVMTDARADFQRRIDAEERVGYPFDEAPVSQTSRDLWARARMLSSRLDDRAITELVERIVDTVDKMLRGVSDNDEWVDLETAEELERTLNARTGATLRTLDQP